MTFQIGQQVRVNSGYRYGAVGTIVGFADHAYIVDIPGVGRRDFLGSDLLDVYANNGD